LAALLGGRLRPRRAPRHRAALVDLDDERLPCPRAADLDRPRQRVSRVDRGIARLELVTRVQVPARIRDCNPHRVPRIDRQHRLEIPREMSVQVALLERELVDHCISLCTASTTRATDGMYASSICQYGYGTS